ncbi:MAG: UDP-N-acetylmuramoyl-L-alanine--D-glutamate ligase [Agathobacter sp.]|nr:UDP-N-acetylmuramoyl-L-alanine--D-glutamate ligase [Lachnospiraceae bacterium]MDY2620090.1 UDP-N-acetylmuramoyl-L-alanine--D-glutamate ligase [Agathobacter sp.]
MKIIEEQKVLVVGTGISGIAAAELLQSKNVDTVLFDGNKELDLNKLYEKAPELKDMPIILGELTEEQMHEFGVAVLSPGVPTDLPMVERLRAQNVAIWGEIELAYYFGKGRLIAITGTNGKTTTTALTGAIMKNYYKDVRIVGNIGIPYTSEAATMTDDTVTVAEISSFQLETIHDFCPDVSAILNITEDHLNRHHTMECYIKTKEDITRNQTKDQVCVLNYEDEVLRSFGESAPAKVVYFSSHRKLDNGFYLEGEDIYYAVDGQSTHVINVNELNLLGRHNYENVMAACAMSVNFGVPMDKIVEVLKIFQAVEHRIEYVTEKRGVKFYNDSKGTNPDAAIQGIRAMNRPTFLIGGGYDKQSEYDEWIEAFDGKVKKLVLIGQTAEKIENCAHRHGFMDTVRKDTFEEAIQYCYDNAKSGDAVLLSPACASWGMFPNYEERGRIFKEYVRNLEE